MKRLSLVMLGVATVLMTALGVVRAGPPAQIETLGVFLLNARVDLELLADTALGAGQRPDGWTGNADVNSPTASADLWFDTELLANALYGPQERLAGWIGATTNRADILARNVRHDIELIASDQFGFDTRPQGWRGGPALTRCDRTIQNAVALYVLATGRTITTSATTANYCAAVAAEVGDVAADSVLAADRTQLAELTLAVRGDLERLADETQGLFVRPVGYRRNTEQTTPTFNADLFLDLELLADAILGRADRPDNWIGVIANDALLFYRIVRHDLELLADLALGPNTRPRGWQNEDPLARCEPLVQNLVLFVEQAYQLTPDVVSDTAYCLQAEAEANRIAENPPVRDVVAEERGRYVAESDYAFAYLDVSATQYMGIMPGGVEFRAWYRNYLDASSGAESRMMFVSGDDFALFIDRRWTTLAEEDYLSLPTLEGVKPLTFCDARWCNGPAPTPTPTGSGPLELLLLQTTPPAPPGEGQVGTGERTQVSWNHIRVTYLQDNAQTRTAQVTLEICNETAQITCEPVLRVFDNAAGATKPVLSQFNGLNVYDFPYGYNTNLQIEGSTLLSPDVWISDPTIR